MAALVALVYFVIFLIPACVVRPSTKGHVQQGRRSFGVATNPGRVGPGQTHVHTTSTHTPTLTRAHTHSKAKTSTEEYQPMSYLPPMFKVDHDCANIRSHILLTIHPYDIHTHKPFHVIHTQVRLDEKNIEKFKSSLPNIPLEDDEMLALVDSGSTINAADISVHFPSYKSKMIESRSTLG